jgi:hypothetical protein
MVFRKIFGKNIRPWQVALIGCGSFVGLLMIWLPLQIYFDVTAGLKTHKELWGGQYIVINKGISVFNTIGLSKAAFSSNEIDELKKQKGVKKVAVFSSNNFRAMASAGLGDGGPGLVTEIFFEAVPNNFIDQLPMGWDWREGEKEISVIVPSDYLSLYNFGFAPGQGLPQISQGMAKSVQFDIYISTPRGEIKYKGRIAGFSDRINTILVPQTFLDFANAHYATKEAKPPSRVIVETDDAGAVATYLDKVGYETNQEALKGGKVQSISRTVMKVSLIFGGFIVLLSLGSFLQFSDLLIARSDYEIQTLSYLGYTYQRISGIIFRQVFILIIISMLLAAVAGILIRHFLIPYFAGIIENPSGWPDVRAIGVLIAMVVIYLGISYLNVLRQAKTLAKAKG